MAIGPLTDAERKQRVASLLERPTTSCLPCYWIGDDGWIRKGRTGDMIAMMDDLGVRWSAQ